uniref:BRCA2-interacting transcriptional repressor EMSY isoform X2 n=1 Tax=Myxine glutinosa TaxID=7769 RepID=UPI00358F645C
MCSRSSVAADVPALAEADRLASDPPRKGSPGGVTMPAVWPALVDLSRDECRRMLRKLEMEAYAAVVSALRAQGDLSKDKKDLLGELGKIFSISTDRHRAEVRRAVNDERLSTISHHMSGPNNATEWAIEGRRLVPLLPRLLPQTIYSGLADSAACSAAAFNARLPPPGDGENKEVVCYSYSGTSSTPSVAIPPTAGPAQSRSPRPASPASSVVVLPSGSTVYVKSVSCPEDEDKPRKCCRTSSPTLPPAAVTLPPVASAITPTTAVTPGLLAPQSTSGSLIGTSGSSTQLSSVKITFSKSSTTATASTAQKVIIVSTSAGAPYLPSILSKPHSLSSSSTFSKSFPITTSVTTASCTPTVVLTSSTGSSLSSPSPLHVSSSQGQVVSFGSTASTTVSTISASAGDLQAGSIAGKVMPVRPLAGRLSGASPLSLTRQGLSPASIQTSQAAVTGVQSISCGVQTPLKSTFQIKQESGVKIITQHLPPGKFLPKSGLTLPGSGGPSPPIVVMSNTGTLVSSHLAPSHSVGAARMTTAGGTTYLKTTSGSIITVVPKSLASLGGRILPSSVVSGSASKLGTVPVSMASKSNVIVVQKAPGKSSTLHSFASKGVMTTLLGSTGSDKPSSLTGTKPTVITATCPGIPGSITKMIVTQKGASSSHSPPITKVVSSKLGYSSPQVLIKPKPQVFPQAGVYPLPSSPIELGSRPDCAKPKALDKGSDGSQGITLSKDKSSLILQAPPKDSEITSEEWACELVRSVGSGMDPVSSTSYTVHKLKTEGINVKAQIRPTDPGEVTVQLPPSKIKAETIAVATSSVVALSSHPLPAKIMRIQHLDAQTCEVLPQSVAVSQRAPSDHDYPGASEGKAGCSRGRGYSVQAFLKAGGVRMQSGVMDEDAEGILDPQTGIFHRFSKRGETSMQTSLLRTQDKHMLKTARSLSSPLSASTQHHMGSMALQHTSHSSSIIHSGQQRHCTPGKELVHKESTMQDCPSYICSYSGAITMPMNATPQHKLQPGFIGWQLEDLNHKLWITFLASSFTNRELILLVLL